MTFCPLETKTGSSPLSRGIRGAERCSEGVGGIIPALAGNTRSTANMLKMHADHPRSRGEYQPHHPRPDPHRGSSPLSRGIPGRRGNEPQVRGIIPALAGNTSPVFPDSWVATDHPRSRGEYVVTGFGSKLPAGSSPLSRGIPRAGAPRGRGLGIIPALAGNTSHLSSKVLCCKDHPRSRGEYELFFFQLRRRLGSSPLSRGILVLLCERYVSRRIIPALAGNTR